MNRSLLLAVSLLMTQPALADYESGQVWKYKTRAGEEGSLIYIAKVDAEKGHGSIYHIYVDGLRIRNPHLSGGIQSELPHAPVDKAALDASVTGLVRDRKQIPDISGGYATWREAFDAGEAGVFNIPVAKIVDYIELAISNAQ
jgi:hypothetical protein